MELEQPATDSAAIEEVASESTEAFSTEDQIDGDDLPNEQESDPVDDEAEDEIDGLKVRGKKDLIDKLKSERLMQADYTRKTQEVAEQRKAFEAERASHQQITQAYLKEVAQIVSIDDRLSQFAKADWNALSDQDPAGAQKLYFEYQRLQSEKTQLVNSLTQKQQQAAMEQQQNSARFLQEARAVVEREIPGWSPELQVKLADQAKSMGYRPEEVSNITDPRAIKVLHKAYLYDQLIAKRKESAPATPPPPVTRVSGSGATATRKLSQMSDAEYAAARRNYIKNHR